MTKARAKARTQPRRARPARVSGLGRVLLAAVVLLALLAAALGVLVLRVGPEKLEERALHFVPGMTAVLVVPEGFTLFQLAVRLEELEICSAAEFLQTAKDPAVLGPLGIRGDSAEGYLFPATYELVKRAPAERVLGKLVKQRRKRLGAWARETKQAELTELELLTLASLVERETAIDAERPRIARVFLNRLADVAGPTRGRLQSDPTAAYGCLRMPDLPSCPKAPGNVSPVMLKDAANPYNTYRIVGLPPGPIANPGDRSIEAVLRPSPGDELYFVADGRGGHRFSRTFEQHRQAIEQLKATQN